MTPFAAGAACALGLLGYAPLAQAQAHSVISEVHARATPPANPAIAPPAPGYELVFDDEFDGDELDRSRWCTRLANSGGAPLQVADADCTGPNGQYGSLDYLTDEQQRYVDFNTRGEKMHVLKDGVLQLRATKTRSDSYASYESAMIRSKFAFAPGANDSYDVQARVQFPSVRGSFPAVWLASGFGTDGQLAWPPEIDLVEAAYNEKDDKANMVSMRAHVMGPQTASGNEEITQQSPLFDPMWDNFDATSSLRDTWLELEGIWDANSICYYINGMLAMCENYRWVTADGKAANPGQLILNFAIGGAWAGRYGIDDASFPTAVSVDYVRVFHRK